MGRFDFDDILKDLGDPDPNAPKEPSPVSPEEHAPQAPAPEPDTASAQGTRQSGASGPASATRDQEIFRRNDPRDTPRPPDPAGEGLGKNIDPTIAAECADPTRIRPNDALSVLYTPDAGDAEPRARDIGDYLLEKEVITAEQLASARRVVRQSPGRDLAESLIESGVDEISVQSVVAELMQLPFERVDFEQDDAVEVRAFRRLGIDYCKQHLVLPLRMEGRRLVVGSTNPRDVFLLDEIRRRLKVESVKHVLVTAYDVRGVIETFTEEDADDIDVDEILADVEEDDVEIVRDEGPDVDFAEEAESSPVVRYVNHIIQTALKEGASDIHVEPGEKKLKVRFRIDGVLFEMMNPPHRMHAALTSRIKIMANLDIAERRLPQDGRIRVTVLGRKLDLRVSTVPTPHGEKTVMRILDNRSIQVGLNDLGFSEDTLHIWKNQIKQPHGIILVTGPTGSGKTTTLYSSLRQMDTPRLNVSTVEDPVEYQIGGITQIQTHELIGMTFAKALKSLLRQDPDVVMIGEIRDIETATIAIQAALTGHLVLSTLHTNDAPSSVTRMINIGIEPFLIGAALNAVLAQRLVRRICTDCAKSEPVPEEMVDFLRMHGVTLNELAAGTGCGKCRETGYIGRLGLYELLVLDDFLRDEIAKSPNVTEFRRVCTERGMVTLRQDGFNKVQDGRTTVEEVLRVTEATI